MLESSNVVEVVERVVVKGLVEVSDYLPVLRMRCGFLAWFLGMVSWRGFLVAPRGGVLPRRAGVSYE